MGRKRVVRLGGLLALSFVAMLLWSKLKLVSGIPRTAYADPKAAEAGPQGAGSDQSAAGARPRVVESGR